MDREEAVKKRVRALIALGVNQKAFAAAVSRHPAWIGRWLQNKTRPLEVRQEEGLEAYVDELERHLKQLRRRRPDPKEPTAAKKRASQPPHRKAG